MSYRIEITADSLSELAGRVLALSVQLQTTTAPVAYVPPVPVKDAAPAKTAAKKIAALIAEATAPETVPEPAAELVAEPVAGPGGEPAANPVAAPVATLDFNADVAPTVLAYVAARGRSAMEEVLTLFGVSRASHVSADLLPELLATLKAGLQ